MVGEEDKSTNTEDNEEEEEVNHEHIGNPVTEIDAEEVPALIEEVEGKLLDISFIYYEEKCSCKGIFADVLRDTVIEEEMKGCWEDEVDQKYEGKFIEEEFQIVCKEAQTVWIFIPIFLTCVVVFMVE